jgi:prepilin-type N-terminal cleavage/methylation domain-containing protein
MSTRSEQGFTLIELLVTLVIGMTVILAAFSVFDAGGRATVRVQDRTALVQSGRTILEQVTQMLRSQVCLGLNSPAITQGDNNSITFYTDVGDESFVPQRRMLVLSGGTLTETDYDGTGTPPNMTYPTTPTRTRVLGTNIKNVSGTPFIRYYTFTGTSPITPSLLLPTPLSVGSTGDAARVVQLDISFATNPEHSNYSGSSTPFEGVVYTRTSDPTDPTHSPQCT